MTTPTTSAAVALAREAMELAKAVPPGVLKLTTYQHGGGRLIREDASHDFVEEELEADFYAKGYRDLLTHAGTHYAEVAAALLAAAARLEQTESALALAQSAVAMWRERLEEAERLLESSAGRGLHHSANCLERANYGAGCTCGATDATWGLRAFLARRGAPPA